MTGLQEAFYIVGLIYMGLSLVVIISILLAIGIIRRRVVDLERLVREKIEVVTSLSGLAGDAVKTVRKFTKHTK